MPSLSYKFICSESAKTIHHLDLCILVENIFNTYSNIMWLSTYEYFLYLEITILDVEHR